MIKSVGFLFGFGALFTVFGGVFIICWPAVFINQLINQLVLTPNSSSFKLWETTPIPMYLQFYMFNLTNVDELMAGTATKMKFEQLGPYVYEESHVKSNLTWNTNDTVTFYNKRTWHYQPDRSNGSLNDLITNINVVMATIAYQYRGSSLILQTLINGFLHTVHESLFVTKTVDEWLFEGYHDPIIDLADRYNISIDMPFTKFGWFVDRNNSLTFDGIFNMHTGGDNIDNLGILSKWNNVNNTGFYDGECGAVKGSTGELWPPEFEQEEVTVFSSDLCTYLTLHRDRDVMIQGINGVRYATNETVFDNGHKHSDLSCFCHDRQDCPPFGALNISQCRYGAPAFVSLPHFYRADAEYLENIEGLNPELGDDFELTLELITGIPLEVKAQLQINIYVERSRGITMVNKLPDKTYVPMLYFIQNIQITDEYAKQARMALLARFGFQYLWLAICVLGILLLIIAVILLIKYLYYKNVERILPNPDIETDE